MAVARASGPSITRLAARFADRYDLVRLLKDGEGVRTYLAVDSTTALQVVLKVFDASSVAAGSHARFVHETRVLRELSGIGLCALHDSGRTESELYLAQQYVPGETLDEVLRRGPLPVADTLQLGAAVAAALAAAHAAGVCHRDVKPANIVVGTPGEDDERPPVTLIDFGFARSPWLAESIRDDVVGTVRYLSPEAAGSLSAPVDERSDLYALGVVFYECLTGRPPFTAPGVGELLRQHLSSPVPELAGGPDGVPRALAAVVHRLLRKDPAERYQSAAAVRADLAQILAGIEAGSADPPVVIGRQDRRRTLTDPAFVGREAELATLTGFASSLFDDTGGLVLLEADSGGGKSRLLGELAKRAADTGVAVLHGQGIALGGQRPFTLLQGVAADLAALFAADPDGAARLAADTADVAPTIVRALPVLRTVLDASPEQDAGPEQFGELRSLGALRRLLATAGTAHRPVLLMLDDCQWSDALTIRLLAELFTEPEHAPSHLGVIAAFRAEEVPAESPLRAIRTAQHVHLGPLPARSVALLAESMAGPLPDDAVQTVSRLADGNPFMAAAVLRGLVESGAIVAEPEGWVVDSERLPDAQAARRSAAFLVRRLELLEPAALELLSVGAVLGKQFDIARAVRIAGSADDAAAILADARHRRLLWVDEGSCTFFHDKIRESLLARLAPDVRRELHSQAADDLLPTIGETPVGTDLEFDLAYHLHEAGRHREALPHALAAAELARGRYALDVAAAHYRMAAEGADEQDVATRRRIAEGLGDVLTLQGGYPAAQREFAAARALVSDPAQAVALDGKLGALAFKQGDIPTAKHALEGALRLLGRRVPRGAALVLACVWELLVQAGHTVAPRLTTGRRTAQPGSADVLAMQLYSRLAYLYWFHSGKIACAWAHLRGMNLAERYRPSAELGQAWSEHAPVMTMLPWYRRGVRYVERSLAIRRELGDVWGQGQSLNFTGVVQYAASDFDAAQAAFDEAIRLLRRTGDQWEVNTAGWNQALCLLRTGELAQSVEVARQTFETARAIGDQTAAGIALSIWARAADGRLPGELVLEQLAAGIEDAQTTAELQLADGLVRRAAGDLQGAIAAIEAGIATIRKAGLRQEYIAPLFAWHATVLREFAEQSSAYAPRIRAARIRAAGKAARTACRWARWYRNNAPHAQREAAQVAALRGRPRRSARHLRRSLAAADRIGARYEQALTRLVRAQLAGDGMAVTAAQAARDALVAPPTEPPAGQPAALSAFDRFASLLHAGRAIAAATTQAGLETAVREAAVALLRAERCHLVPSAALGDARLTTRSGADVDGLSRTLLCRAIDEGVPVVALDEAAGPADSLVLSGVRSALAAPIFVHGEPRLILYVTHRQLGELFGDDEVQLAAFIATLAGAGYEHLLGSETRFRALAQSSSDVITLVGADGIVGYQSAAVRSVFGLPPSGLIGAPVASWVHPDDAALVADALALAAAQAGTGQGGTGQRVECRLRHADGSYRFAESVVTNLLAEPTVAALVLNTRDITDRKLAADQLRLAEDRERIARDLHDVVIQRLFAVGLSLDALSARLPDEPARQVMTATDELHQTIRDIRGAIFTLRTDDLAEPLHERLTLVAEQAAGALGFAPSVRIDPSIDAAPAPLHWHLIALLREALSNAARHAAASSVDVDVAVVAGFVVARIADDGRGLPVDRHESGLANLRRRAAGAGGSMTIEANAAGRGLVLTWRVPVADSAPPAC